MNSLLQTIHMIDQPIGRSENLLHELDQMFLIAYHDSGLFSQERENIVHTIESLLRYLRGGEQSKLYTQVVHIVSKYIAGIKRFLSRNSIRELSLYQTLFEGAFIAIIYEISHI